jgi:hypothetical protein
MNRRFYSASLVRMEEGSRRAAAAAAVLPDELIVEILALLRSSRSAAASASRGPGAPSSPTRPTDAGSRRRCRASSSPAPTAAARPGTSSACPCLRYHLRLPGSIRPSPSCPPPVGRWSCSTPATGSSSCAAPTSMNLLRHHLSTSCAIQPPGSGLPYPNQSAPRVRLAILEVSVQR